MKDFDEIPNLSGVASQFWKCPNKLLCKQSNGLPRWLHPFVTKNNNQLFWRYTMGRKKIAIKSISDERTRQVKQLNSIIL